jgi:hypothetical protein
MKRIFTPSFLLASLFLTGIAGAQTSSVALKDGTGATISSHTSVTDAYTAIPATLTQAYTIELNAAYNGSTETFPIVFTAKAGAGAANTITLRPAAGVTSMTIQSNASGTPIINLNDADYIVIDGRAGGVGAGVLTIRNNATTSSSNTLQLINGACFNIFRNVEFYNATTSGTGRAVYLSSSASNTSGNSDNLFRYCTFNGGRYMFNNSGTAANPNTRNTIYGSNFRNANFAAYWAQAGAGKIRIDSCSVFCTTPINESLYLGLLFDSQADSAIIVNNRFYDIQATGTAPTVRYVYIRSVVSTGTNVAEIRNNFFSMMTGNATVVNLGAIEMSSGANLFKARVAHNSVRFGGTFTGAGTSGNVGSSGLLISSTNAATTFSIQNNLFVNERSGGTAGLQHLAMAITNTVSTFNISGNTYNAISGNLTRWGSTVNTSIAAHQAIVSGGEPSANNAAVTYVSATDLHLTCATASSPSISATQVPGITVDIDGNPRGASTMRGADEAMTVMAAIGTQSNVSCNGLSNGSVTVNVSGGTLPYTYTWSPSGGNAATATGLAAGNYTVTINDAAGCSSTKTVTITQPAAIDASTTLTGSTIRANATGATYQWINCADNTPVSGQTAQTFTPSVNGSYKVTVTMGACSNTSSCVAVVVSNVGIEEQAGIAGLQLYPNPGTGLYTLVVTEQAEVIVSNVMGEIVLKQSIGKGDNVLNLEHYPNGIYSVSVIAKGRSSALKLVKQ